MRAVLIVTLVLVLLVPCVDPGSGSSFDSASGSCGGSGVDFGSGSGGVYMFMWPFA